jgi:GPH family glycoside/pentoside/hexuronide:cation symporter
MVSPQDRLPARALALYALPATGLTAMHWLLMLYLLKFSTDVVGLAPALVGGLFAAARIWDAVTDPIAGWASDRTRSRMGRRRPWMFASALPLAIGFWALWTTPAGVPDGYAALWLGAALLLFYTAQTAFGIPHFSLGAELSTRYHERTRISAARVGAEMIGMGTAIGALHLLENAGSPESAATLVTGAVASATLISILYSSLLLRERPENQDRGSNDPFRAMRDVARNPHAVRLVTALLFAELGLGSVMVAIPYASEQLTGSVGNSSFLLLGFLVPFALSVPLWLPLTRRFGKARCWAASTAVCALGFASLGLFGLGSVPLSMCIAGAIGFAQAAMMTIPISIKADVIDWDEARTGERKEGSYFAAWNLVHKLGSGLSVAVVGFAIQGDGGVVDPAGVRFVITAMPAGFLAISTLVLMGFRFGEREHSELRRSISAHPHGVERAPAANAAAELAA